MAQWTDAMWQAECGYISLIADKQGKTKEFNFDTDCFLRYCEMQRDQAEKQGFFDSAEYIQHCIDDLRV
jgi:hypothetical protein